MNPLTLLDRPLFARYAFLGLAFVALVLGFFLPPGHDYIDYIKQWSDVLAGRDPWDYSVWPVNAYGPLHALMAPGTLLAPTFNRVVYVCAWLWLSVWSLRRLREANAGSVGLTYACWAAVWFAGPFFWVFTVAFGTHDVLVALSCVLALYWTERDRPLSAGAVLAAGFLLKFIPILILPFLVLPSGFLRSGGSFSVLAWARRLDLRLAGAFVVLACSVFAAAFLVWGDSVLNPLLLGAERPSSTLSVFRYLRGEVSPLRWFGVDAPDLDTLSLPLMLGVYGLVGLWYGLGNLRRGAAVTTALLAIVLFYKVGHHQFYAPLFFLVPLAVYFDRPDTEAGRAFQLYGAAVLLWLCVLVLIYLPIRYRNEEFRWLNEWLGMPTFLVGLLALVGMLRAGWQGESASSA